MNINKIHESFNSAIAEINRNIKKRLGDDWIASIHLHYSCPLISVFNSSEPKECIDVSIDQDDVTFKFSESIEDNKKHIFMEAITDSLKDYL